MSENYPNHPNYPERPEINSLGTGQFEADRPNSPEPRPIDIEVLVQLAIERSGNLPWSRVRDRELAFDKGLTVKPRKRAIVSWLEAEAMAGISFEGKAPPARMHPGPDLELVINAIKRLEPRMASAVIACGRAKIRPNCMLGVVPKRVARTTYGYKRNGKRRGRPVITMVWDVDPKAICLARELYSAWHAALTRIMHELRDRLSNYSINGFLAPASPWEVTDQKIA